MRPSGAKDRKANDSRNAVRAPLPIRNGEVGGIQYQQNDIVGGDVAQWKVWRKCHVQLILNPCNPARTISYTRHHRKMQLRCETPADDRLVCTSVKNSL